MNLNKNVILLVNLGSPNSLNVNAIRKFLWGFLSDRRVVNLPRLIWYPILYGIILPFRSRRLIHQYKEVWIDGKSPLVHYTELQAKYLQQEYSNTVNNVVVCHAFCYSDPEIGRVLTNIHKQYNVDKLTVLPLYPQFSSTTTAAVFDLIAKFYCDKKEMPELHFIRDFHMDKPYIQAIAASILKSWKTNGKAGKLIFSYHSLPQAIIDAGDPYYQQCLTTTKAVARQLGIDSDEYIVAFQSKFGRQKWLSPSTANVLTELANNGTTSVDIICPGFVSDCLETLEEILVTNRDLFISHGGSKYQYIPCLNASDDMIKLLFTMH
jgi:protoporphyrin/coproporphyrin ferrochelatase